MVRSTTLPVAAITVLIVEDEPLVRLVVREMVEDMHLNVLDAADGEEGLAFLRANPAIKLVISDVSMPRMDGITMIAKARESRADFLVL